jgi:hypothetical protein
MVDDITMRDTLLGLTAQWQEYKQIIFDIESGREAAVRSFDEANAEALARAAVLKELFDRVYTRLISYTQDEAIATDRRTFVSGIVRVQKRRRAGAYDPTALEQWVRAKKFNRLLTFPDGKTPESEARRKVLLREMRDKRAAYLDVDTKEAIKAAIETYDDGGLIHPDSPVPVEEYITEVSWKSFEKTMDTLAVEADFDAQGLEDEE